MLFLREEDVKFKHLAMVAIVNLKKGWQLFHQVEPNYPSSHQMLLFEKTSLNDLLL